MRQAVLLLLVFLQTVCGDVDLANIYCPICDMVVEKHLSVSFRGNQQLHVCFMGGHWAKLHDHPEVYMTGISRVTSFESPYTSDNIACPVCGMTSWDSAHAISFRGQQKLFTCSKDHAETIRAHPTTYLFDPNATDNSFCTGASAMFDGFQSSIGGTCSLLLFKPWVLNSSIKYAAAFIGILLSCMFLELFGEFRQRSHDGLMKQFGTMVEGYGYSQAALAARYGSMNLNTNSSLKESLILLSSSGNNKVLLPFWCHGILACLYMLHIAIAYFIMLIVMGYESGLFVAVILGLGLGFLVFKDTEGETMSKNIDPCCST